MKCSGENVILRGIVHVVSGFPLHFMFYCGNFDCFSNRVIKQKIQPWKVSFLTFWDLKTDIGGNGKKMFKKLTLISLGVYTPICCNMPILDE